MEVTTIACPTGFTDPNVTEDAPIWLDANNVEYQVTSGILEGYQTSAPTTATPNRINIVVGMSGLDALEAMGLKVKEIKEI